MNLDASIPFFCHCYWFSVKLLKKEGTLTVGTFDILLSLDSPSLDDVRSGLSFTIVAIVQSENAKY